MAEWKKVIVSGSNAHLNHVTASGDISASGKLYGNLDENTDQIYVVVYNPNTGELEYKELNLVSTVSAPNLFVFDPDGERNVDFRLGFDRGSVTQPLTAPYRVSASIDAGSTYSEISANNNDININGSWTDQDISDIQYYLGASVNITGSIDDRRDGLYTNGTDGAYTKQAIKLYLNAVSNTNTAVPEYDTNYAPNLNYGNRAFRDGGIGKLEIYVNDNATPQRTFDLEASFDAVDSTLNDIRVELFATQSNLDSVGNIDTTKHYRSGSITINTNAQDDGYNYAYIIHTGSKNGEEFRRITNFYEWFYDIAGHGSNHPMVATAGNTENPTFSEASGHIHYVSGIKFFNSASADGALYRRMAQCTKQYKHIYNNAGGIKISMDTDLISGLTVTQSGAHLLTNPTKTTEDVSSTETVNLASLADTDQSYDGVTKVTASFSTTFDGVTGFHQPDDFISSPFGALNTDFNFGTNGIEFENPNKADKSISFDSIQDFMVNTLDSSSVNNVFENFRGEEKRIISRSYTFGDDPTSSTYAWDSTQDVDGDNTGGNEGHSKGLIQYYSHLVYPTKAGDSGNFNPTLGPSSNANYSSVTAENRYYIRYFRCPSAAGKEVQVELVGSGKVCAVGNSNLFYDGSDGINLYIARLGPASGLTNSAITSFTDMTGAIRVGAGFSNNTHYIPLASTAGNIDYDVTAVGSPSINVTTGTVPIQDANASLGIQTNEYLAVMVVVPQNWTGYIDSMAMRFGGFTGTTTPVHNSYSQF